MSRPSNPALGLSRALLSTLIVLNLALGAVVVLAFLASFVFEDTLAASYRRRGMDAGVLVPTLRVMIVLGAPYVATLHRLLSRLREIVETVQVGAPFVPENAARLKTIAWCMLVLQLLHLGFGVTVAIAAAAKADIDWSFSISGWVAVVLLFVLARVFEEGTRMRDDLEAMI